MNVPRLALVLLLLLSPGLAAPDPEAAAPATRRILLNGDWKFAADYQDWGERTQWFSPGYGDGTWDRLKVPGTWSHDPRFMGFIGAGWYRHRFTAPAVGPGEHVRINFAAVFAKARVWLNGEFLGEHDGGYTPFEFDVTRLIKPGAVNLLVVCADNRWKRWNDGNQPQQQVVAWWDDGGIIRDVALLVGSPVHVVRHKVEPEPDLAAGTASVRAKVWIRNAGAAAADVQVGGEIRREGRGLGVSPAARRVTIPAGETITAELALQLPAGVGRLWELDSPVLHEWRTTVQGHDQAAVAFGLRRFEVKGTQLLLNGRPLRLAGANRHASYPGGGQDEPAEIVERDLRMMKEGGFVFQRLSHYPVATAVLDWADRHGMLLIAEASHAAAGGAAEMDRADVRARFQREFRELIERDWNRPSIVAWSVGNEYASDTPAGLRWTRDMMAFARELDPTRHLTFATNSAAKANLRPEDEGSRYVDFICLNTYAATARKNLENIDTVHRRWPDKPILVSEYGLRHDFVDDEAEREDWFREMLAGFRARPFVAGASIWSFNDYRSRYVGTNPNGWREWGVIDPERRPRGTYHVLRREHGGFVVREASVGGGAVTIRLEPRTDFPVYPGADAELLVRFVDGQFRPIGEARVPVRPGEAMRLPLPPGAGNFRAEIWRGGFRTATFGQGATN